MKYFIIILLIGLIAAFYPRSGKDKDPQAPGRKEKMAYLILSAGGLTLGILQAAGMNSTLAGWLDDIMELFFKMVTWSSV